MQPICTGRRCKQSAKNAHCFKINKKASQINERLFICKNLDK